MNYEFLITNYTLNRPLSRWRKLRLGGGFFVSIGGIIHNSFKDLLIYGIIRSIRKHV